MRTKDLVDVLFRPIGFRIPDESLFSKDLNSYYLDWYDTEEIQSLLRYQNTTIEQWSEQILAKVRFVIPLVKLFNERIIRWIEMQSPYYEK